MQLTDKQQQGLQIAISRFRNKEPYTVISGYAGTGKSTLIKFIVSALDLDPDSEVAYITFTGKASEVLRAKGCPNAQTAHKLLYWSKQLPNGKFTYKPRTALDKDYKLIVVDEVSMLPIDMWELLLRHQVYVIACGDPFQIPPIDKKKDNHILEHPHIFLDEIMRQAKESDIIITSMDIREGKRLLPKEGNDIRIFSRSTLSQGMYNWADQIITATNKTRREINDCMRAAANRGPEPEIGDKLICLRNCWDSCSEIEENPLINGSIGYIAHLQPDEIPYRLNGSIVSAPILRTDLIVNDDCYHDVWIDYKALTTGEKFFTPQQEYLISRDKSNLPLPVEFNYGYSITGHKSQGSQWNKVFVLEESFPFDREEHLRWLYTTVTRASEKLTLVLKD